MRVEYHYFAVKPIRAEHPIGSGVIVEYLPGQEIPANDWGRAANNLVELGKAARVAFNIPEEGDDQLETVELQVGVTPGFTDEGQPTPDGASHVTVPVKRGPGRPRKNP